ncbi:MAG: long-chain fatty acid--CoA ligase [bacterium]|nr:long-chain fatty acid--CoA ligase [bacterium]
MSKIKRNPARPMHLLHDLLTLHTKQVPDSPFLWSKNNTGTYTSISFRELSRYVANLAHHFHRNGIVKGDTLAIWSNNNPYWVIADLACLRLGIITVPLYPSLCDEDAAFILNDSGAKALVTDTPEHMASAQALKSQCKSLEHTWKMSSHIKEYMEIDTAEAPPEVALSDTDTVSLIYTSGTTGNPKGVVLTHQNIMSNVRDILDVIDINQYDRVLSFLPLSHVFERTVGYYIILAAAGQIYYATDISTVADDMQLAKPTIVVSVPRLYEKIHARVLDGLTPIKRLIFAWALRVGNTHLYCRDFTKPRPKSAALKLATKLVFSKIYARTGGKLRFFVSGGAPLNPAVHTFFESIGLPIIEGYGLTESSPILACNLPEKRKPGTVGKALPSVSLRLGELNELQAKGPNIMQGYFNLPEKTKDAFTQDGWLRTGDVAQIDEDGFVSIVDRIKELLVLSNGKNVAPLPLEEAIKTSRYINQVMVIGDKRNFVSALIVPNYDALKQESVLKGFSGDDATLANHPETIKFIQGIIDKKMDGFSHYETVKKCHVLSSEFSEKNGELTPTLKLKRKVILEHYKSEIDRLYNERV